MCTHAHSCSQLLIAAACSIYLQHPRPRAFKGGSPAIHPHRCRNSSETPDTCLFSSHTFHPSSLPSAAGMLSLFKPAQEEGPVCWVPLTTLRKGSCCERPRHTVLLSCYRHPEVRNKEGCVVCQSAILTMEQFWLLFKLHKSPRDSPSKNHHGSGCSEA